MKPILPVLLAAAALAACSTTGQAVGPNLSPPVARPSAAPGLDWILNAEEDSARLTYGTPESDDMRLSLECRGGQVPELGLIAVGPRGAPAEIVITSGGKTHRYPALSEDEEMSGGVLLMARARKTDPVIVAFRETGWLSVGPAGGAENLIPQHNTSAVEDFFEWCK